MNCLKLPSLFIIACFSIVIISCKKSTQSNEKRTVIFSGKIENYYTNVFSVKGEGRDKKIKLDEEGTFLDTLTVKEGFYTMALGEYYNIPLYIGLEDELVVNFNFKGGITTLQFVSSGDNVNTFINTECVFLDVENKAEFDDWHKLNEDDFIKRLDRKKKELNKLIEKSNYTQNFKELQKKNIEFDYISLVKSYPRYNCFFVGKSYREVSYDLNKYYPKIKKLITEFITNVGLDNEIYFSNSVTYSYLVTELFTDKIINQIGGYDNYSKFNEEAIKEIRNYKSAKIKDALLWQYPIRSLTSSNPDYEKIYYGVKDLITKESLKKYVEETYQSIKALAPGSEAPDFTYKNAKGEKVSLSNFKGKYVYLDIWGTWCNPCKQEIPYLKKLEQNFHKDNIVFMSVSVNDKRDVWEEFIEKEKLKGIQLHEDREKSEYNITQLYKISGYPTFVLINPEGKIITVNAMRPSNPEINNYIKNILKK
ncbi:TlpA family protein disulfide reductase [Tenacibaculum sp. TC6]|uniref:TlpA family protein disulfide reductase n=1 Tax=Tenacibaculum sp. TC6 TaxID=3423223 RepID=UPI003D36CEE7